MPIVSDPTEVSDGLVVTAAEVAEHVGAGTLSPEDDALVTDQIALYQAELEGILGRGVTRVTRTESVPLPLSGDRWTARRGPVHAIITVTSGEEVLVSGTGYARNRHGAEVWGGTWLAGTSLVVTYEGGWDDPDNRPAKQAVMARTARWWNRRSDDDVGVEQSTVEGHSVKWVEDAFSPSELRACSRLRAPDMAG